MTENKNLTRKDFIKGMGMTLAGVTVAGGLGGVLTGCSSSASAEAAPYPYKYTKMDADKAEAVAYDTYFEKGGWGVGVAEGLFGTMAAEVGYPYNQIPPQAFTLASSGYQQSTLCGALGVASVFIGMVTDVDTSKEINTELYNWYKTAEFPMYQPENLNLKTTIAETTLCEESVSRFMEAEGVKYGDPKRKARCAGVTADVVRKTIELLNARA